MFSFLLASCLASTGECTPMTKTGNNFQTFKECNDQAAEAARYNPTSGGNGIRFGSGEVLSMVGPCIPAEKAQQIEDLHIPKAKR